MLKKYSFALATAWAATLVVGTAQADLVTDLGVTASFLEPTGWNVGDAGSTHQIWDTKTATAGNLADKGYNVAGATLSDPTHGTVSPGFLAGSGNFYSFSTDYKVTADIFNHGGPGLGTHVIVQIGSSVNPDDESYPGHGTGVLLDSLSILDHSGTLLAGGANSEALEISELSFQTGVAASFGLVDYQELFFEFWLPNYTGDFRVAWDQKVHSSLDVVRVDSMVEAVPEPGSLALLGVAGMCVAPFAVRRFRKRG